MVSKPDILPWAMTRWLEWHSVATAAGLLISLLAGCVWPMSVLAGTSFLVGYLSNRASWEAAGPWGGPANLITGIRLSMMLAAGLLTPVLGAWPMGILLGIAASLDGLDGEVARRFRASSLFGEYLDKETDSFFVTMGGLILWSEYSIGLWILLPAGLRVGYVSLRRLMNISQTGEPRFPWGRAFAVTLMVAIPVSLVLPDPFRLYILATATTLVTFSFSRSYYWLIRAVRS